MKTVTLETLRRRAAESSKARGHRLQWRWPFGRCGGPLSQFGRCRHCGAEVLIQQSPAPNGIEIGGEAVAVDCTTKPARSHTPPPWRVGMNPGPIIYGPAGEQIADMRADLLPVGERGQNVRLIVAAPELLAEAAGLWTAATQALAMLERHDPGTAAAIRAEFAQHLRRPAITHATGATAGFPA